jgi:hypothetical protein
VNAWLLAASPTSWRFRHALQTPHHPPCCLLRRYRNTLAATLALLLATVAPAAATWTSCATGATVFKVADVTLVPSPVKPGDVANFTIKADAGG